MPPESAAMARWNKSAGPLLALTCPTSPRPHAELAIGRTFGERLRGAARDDTSVLPPRLPGNLLCGRLRRRLCGPTVQVLLRAPFSERGTRQRHTLPLRLQLRETKLSDVICMPLSLHCCSIAVIYINTLYWLT